MLIAPRYEDFTYSRRVPEQELLHRVLAEHLETFLDRTRTEDHELPRYVEQELREYVTCGGLETVLRLRCDDCHKELVVAFSCKGRGFCPSCTGRRMADTAARLVDDVFPIGVPVRQWVLSLPIDLPSGLQRQAALGRARGLSPSGAGLVLQTCQCSRSQRRPLRLRDVRSTFWECAQSQSSLRHIASMDFKVRLWMPRNLFRGGKDGAYI